MVRIISVNGMLVAGLALIVASASPLVAQKKGKPTGPEPWPCQLTLRDAVDESGNPVDAILSDGQGTYVDGQDGDRVSCHIVQAPGSAHDGWLEVFIDADSARYMNFPARQAQTTYTRDGYSEFQNRGSFEVKYIRDATVTGVTYLKPFRAYVNDPQFSSRRPRLMGDSFATAPLDRWLPDLRGTSSVFVHVIDECTWQVTSDPAAGITVGETATHPRVTRLIETQKNGAPYAAADFTLPFAATVRVIGGKPGCTPP